MKTSALKSLCLLALIGLAACKSGSEDKTPVALKSAGEAKSLVPGKAWVVKDVGLKAYSFNSESNPEAPLAVDWMSTTKEFGEFEKDALKKFTGASIELNKDTVATTTGMNFTGPQTYLITDEVEGDTPPGIRLEISGASDEFKDMGMSKATYTYYVLGANDKTLLLQSPNSVNDRKVILLLELK